MLWFILLLLTVSWRDCVEHTRLAPWLQQWACRDMHIHTWDQSMPSRT